jgi:FkbM family methyltransferase
MSTKDSAIKILRALQIPRLVSPVFRKMGLAVVRLEDALAMDVSSDAALLRLLLDASFRPDEEFKMVQLGANDGLLHDFVRPAVQGRANCRIFLVEPLPQCMPNLEKNYRDAGLKSYQTMNCAVGSENGTLKLAVYDNAGNEDEHSSLISSKYKDNLAQSGFGFKGKIKTIDVPCYTLSTLWSLFKEGDRFDVLVIDVEKMDYEVLTSSMEFLAKTKPKVIVFEHGQMTQPERVELNGKLTGLGYKLLSVGINTFCFQPIANGSK